MFLLMLLTSTVWGQVSVSSPTSIIDPSRVYKLEQSLDGYTQGRSTFTGTPRFQNGIQFTNTSGSALTFQDGTTQNSAPGNGNLTITSGSTLTFSGGSMCVGTICLIGLSSSAVAISTLTIDVSGYAMSLSSRTLELEIMATSSGTVGTGYGFNLCINGDCTGNYKWDSNGSTAGSGLNPSNAAAGMNNRSFNLCPMNSGVVMTTGERYSGKFTLSYKPSVPNTIGITGNQSCQGNSGSNWYTFTIGGEYIGSAPPTKFQLFAQTASGNLLGEMKLYLKN